MPNPGWRQTEQQAPVSGLCFALININRIQRSLESQTAGRIRRHPEETSWTPWHNPWRAQMGGKVNMQECKWTGRRGCQEKAQMVVSSWQRTVGRRGMAHGCVWHTASIWRRWHRKRMHPYNTAIIISADVQPLCVQAGSRGVRTRLQGCALLDEPIRWC